MTSRSVLVLLAILAGTSTIYAQEPTALPAGESFSSAGWLAPAGRPFLLRSDTLSRVNYLKMRSHARRGIDPRTMIPYDRSGFPQFEAVFEVRLSPSQYRSPYYGRIGNEQLYKEILKNPTLRRRFTERDIELLKQGKNPQGYQWHHDKKTGQMKLVKTADHSTDHVGGDKVWGRYDRKTFLRSTALRWGSIAVFDIAISSAGLLYADDFDLDHFGQATTRAIAGGTVAFGTEALLTQVLPQSIGNSLPRWFAGVRILYGSPAAWGATLSYAATRALVDYCWESHRLHQLQIQEQACRAAETKARWQRIDSAVAANDQALGELLVNFNSARSSVP